jgi:hypothetical protein
MFTPGGVEARDFYLLAVLQRSYELVPTFIVAFDAWRFMAAAPLLRVQLDSLSRVAYVARYDKEGAAVAEQIVHHGGEFRRLTHSDGRRLTDATLNKLAAEAGLGWLPDVYASASAWVHLSSHHATAPVLRRANRFEFEFPMNPMLIADEFWVNLVAWMAQVTDRLLGLMADWAAIKEQHAASQDRSRPAQH